MFAVVVALEALPLDLLGMLRTKQWVLLATAILAVVLALLHLLVVPRPGTAGGRVSTPPATVVTLGSQAAVATGDLEKVTLLSAWAASDRIALVGLLSVYFQTYYS
jgi:hypothetical protein